MTWAGILLAGTILVDALAVEVELVRLREGLAVAVFLFCAAAVLGASTRTESVVSRRWPSTLGIFLAGGVACGIGAMAGGTATATEVRFEFTKGFTLWILGWSAFLLARVVEDRPDVGSVRASSANRGSGRPRVLYAAVIFAAAFAVLGAVQELTRHGSTAVIDETLYVLQARLLTHHAFSRPLSVESYPFFMLSQAAYAHGRLFGQYPPGWPAILWLFDRVGALDWAGPISGAAVVALTFVLASRLYSTRVGLIAAVLLATNSLAIQYDNGYWSHAGSTLCLLVAACLAVGGGRASRADWLRWSLVGMALGVAFAVRPLTGVTAGATLVIWYLLRVRPSTTQALVRGAWVLLGALIPMSGVAAYNRATTGSALAFGYSAAGGALQHMGFGTRGLILYDSNGAPKPLVEDFTPGRAIVELVERVWAMTLYLLPPALLVPLLLLARRLRVAWNWRVAAAFSILPLAYAFWYFDSTRFYVDLLPFVFIGIAFVLDGIAERQRRLARAAAVYLVAAACMFSGWTVVQRRERFAPCRESYGLLHSRERTDRLLVFVSDIPVRKDGTDQLLFACLYKFNTENFPGNIVVARDRGEANRRLASELPAYTPVRLRWDAEARVARIDRLAP